MESPTSGGGIVIRPTGVTGVLECGFNLAREHFGVLATTVAWAVVPAYLIGLLLAVLTGHPRLLGTILGIGEAFASIALVIACAHVIAPSGRIGEFSPKSLYMAALDRVIAAILFGLLIAILAIPLIIIFPLGIYLFVRWAVAWYALIIEHRGPIESLGRSWDLTKRSWWHTAGVVFLTALLYLIVAGFFGLIFAAFGGALVYYGNELFASAVFNLGSALGSILIVPFVVAIHVVLFTELIARRATTPSQV
jgi:hypothetical protein